MKTNTPYVETEYISISYPIIKGTCIPGTIKVYNANFELVKTISTESYKFIINLEDVPSSAYTVTNTEFNKEESNYSRIIVKSYNINNCKKLRRCQTI